MTVRTSETAIDSAARPRDVATDEEMAAASSTVGGAALSVGLRRCSTLSVVATPESTGWSMSSCAESSCSRTEICVVLSEGAARKDVMEADDDAGLLTGISRKMLKNAVVTSC